jgi:hypothetical protein
MARKLQKYQKKINCTDVSTSLMDIIKVTKLQIKLRQMYSYLICLAEECSDSNLAID